jgi:N utilization substance protein B
MVKKNHRRSPFEQARIARIAAVQAFYQMLHQEQSSEKVINEFLTLRFKEEGARLDPDIILFQSLVCAADERRSQILEIIKASLNKDWPYERLEYVLKAILYIATAELLAPLTKAPTPVVITEYVSITTSFYKGKESAFVNSYLDRLARNLGYTMTRPAEVPK